MNLEEAASPAIDAPAVADGKDDEGIVPDLAKMLNQRLLGGVEALKCLKVLLDRLTNVVSRYTALQLCTIHGTVGA